MKRIKEKALPLIYLVAGALAVAAGAVWAFGADRVGVGILWFAVGAVDFGLSGLWIAKQIRGQKEEKEKQEKGSLDS